MTIAQHKRQRINISRIFLVSCLILTLVLGLNVLLVQAQTNDNWSEPLNISQSGSASMPIMVVDSDGNFHLLWVDEYSGLIYVAGDGVEWITPVPVVMPFDDSIPYLLADGEGNIHAFWRDSEGALYYSKVRASEFDNYSAWCVKEGQGCASKNKFYQRLEKLLNIRRKRNGGGNGHIWYVPGYNG